MDVKETYTVIGNVNDRHLSIGESTFGGLANLSKQDGAKIDYGSLIYIALARSSNAREAISIMTSLVAEYGYASSGESFSLVDPMEAWVMEMIGKGNEEKGAVWVARRVPDGHITSHANQARIEQIDFTDTEGVNWRWSEDVVTFAQKFGVYPANASATDFSFSGVYDPVDPVSARVSEGRVWSLYNLLGDFDSDKYVDYIMGKDLKNRMPWSVPVKPNLGGLQKKEMKKNTATVTVEDVFAAMRNHKEGTVFDPTLDVGAGPFSSPYRWRPLEWNYDQTNGRMLTSLSSRRIIPASSSSSSSSFSSSTHHYINERTVSTQQTAWQFVAEIRGELPNGFSLNWWAPDDTCCTPRVIYSRFSFFSLFSPLLSSSLLFSPLLSSSPFSF